MCRIVCDLRMRFIALATAAYNEHVRALAARQRVLSSGSRLTVGVGAQQKCAALQTAAWNAHVCAISVKQVAPHRRGWC